MNVLITGAAGFIGYHLTNKLLHLNGFKVVCIDNLNDYYDVNLKFSRLRNLGVDVESLNAYNYNQIKNLSFYKGDIQNGYLVSQIIKEHEIDIIVNLAAQAGVRNSLLNPYDYINSNIHGFTSILEGARNNSVKHVYYASTSSVYGLNDVFPLSEEQSTDRMISPYAVTKKTNELLAHCYSHIYGLRTTGLRFFTVYGPYGRPDMALFKFTERILNGETIDIYNGGNMIRDFTYVDDIVESICLMIRVDSKNDFDCSDSSRQIGGYEILNIGGGNPCNLMSYITTLERELGITAKKNFLPMQPGDVKGTHASPLKLQKKINFSPKIDIELGIKHFVKWYREYYDK